MLKNKKYLNHFFSTITILFLVVPFLVVAQGGGNVPTGGNNIPPNPQVGTIEIKNPFKGDSIPAFLRALVNDILLPIGGVVAVLMVIWAGLLYVTAQGNETKIAKAHQALLWAVIGAAILFGAWVISEAIQGTINALKR